MQILIAIVGETSNHSMETPTPETPAMNAECTVPFEAEPEELEHEDFSEDVRFFFSVLDEYNFSHQDRLTIAQVLISEVTEEFEQDILTYVKETPVAEVDPFIVANTSQVIERLRVVGETLGAVSVEEEDDEDGDEGFDEEDLTG